MSVSTHNVASTSHASSKSASVPSDSKSDRPLEASERQALDECREVLQLWLRWNSAQEQSIAEIFGSGDTLELEDWLDQLEQLRQLAIARSRRLVHESL